MQAILVLKDMYEAGEGGIKEEKKEKSEALPSEELWQAVMEIGNQKIIRALGMKKLFLSKLYIYALIPCIQNLTGSSFSVLMGPLYRTLIAETGQIFVIRTGQYGFPICHAMIFPIHSASCSGVIAPT